MLLILFLLINITFCSFTAISCPVLWTQHIGNLILVWVKCGHVVSCRWFAHVELMLCFEVFNVFVYFKWSSSDSGYTSSVAKWHEITAELFCYNPSQFFADVETTNLQLAAVKSDVITDITTDSRPIQTYVYRCRPAVFCINRRLWTLCSSDRASW